MIVSASRRTDIPCFYSDWFFNRIKEGRVCVRNPFNPRLVSEIPLSPDTVDGIVFWTKNPAPMLDRLELLRDYPYYFQFTPNSYGTDIERNVPSKRDSVIPTFIALSEIIGKERVVWRYDPILLNGKYTVQYHLKYFKRLCGALAGYTEKCTVSFIDMYKSISRRTAPLGVCAPTQEQSCFLAGNFAEIAAQYGIYVDTCAEEAELSEYGIGHASCIDGARLERIGGYRLKTEQDKNQREFCRCVQSVDIGAYNTCRNGCVYCYAGFAPERAGGSGAGGMRHNADSPLIFGEITLEDTVKPREIKSLRAGRLSGE